MADLYLSGGAPGPQLTLLFPAGPLWVPNLAISQNAVSVVDRAGQPRSPVHLVTCPATGQERMRRLKLWRAGP